MDLWVALAAAGADYVAKHWKNSDGKKENSFGSSSGDTELVSPHSPALTSQHIDKRNPFQRLARRKRLEDENSNRIDSKEELGSIPFGNLKDEFTRVTTEALGEISGSLFNEPLIGEVRSQYDSKKYRSSLRTRRSKLWRMKPLTSLDNCLLAQLYNERAEIDTYARSSMREPSRPFIITNGRNIIGSEGANSLNLQWGTGKNRLHEQVNVMENKFVYGVPSLAYDISLEVPVTRRAKDMSQGGKSSSSLARWKHPDSLAGSTNGALLFGIGVSVGIISSLLANKREVDKLNGLLKQTENLVQDLQEELIMKDSLTVKELPSEEFGLQDTKYESYDKRASQSFSAEKNIDKSTVDTGKEVPDQSGDEDSESMSKIEAELEAELERLELNINASSLERRLSDLAESDPNFEPGISKDELRPDMFGAKFGGQPYADLDGSGGSSTPHPVNYSVSAQELTLRLHELIQTKLEERVKELETALEASERKVRLMESEHKMVMREQSDSDSISSPIAMNEPLIINLSGEALDAYNEVYDELKNLNEHKEYDSKGRAKDLNVYQDQSNNVDALSRVGSTLAWQISSGDIGCSVSVSVSESESDGENDLLLIKQYVEKRRNSAAILSVERKLFD